MFDWGAVGSATAPKMAVPVGLSIDGAAPPVPAAAAGIGGTGGFAMGAGGAIAPGIAGADVGMGGAAGKRLAPDCGAAGIAGIAGIGGSGAVGAGIAVAGGNKLAPDIGSGTAGCIVIPPATGGGGSGRSSAGPSVANASIGVWVRVSVYWQRTGSNLRGRQPSAE